MPKVGLHRYYSRWFLDKIVPQMDTWEIMQIVDELTSIIKNTRGKEWSM